VRSSPMEVRHDDDDDDDDDDDKFVIAYII